MPEKRTVKRARQDKREGKSPSTQAGEFVHEEIEHIREGKHGARSAKQAIAIGLSKARRAGVALPPPKKGEASAETRRKARKDVEAGAGRSRKTAAKKASKTTRKAASKRAGTARKSTTASRTRSRATTKALKREGRAAASSQALSRQAKKSARKRTASDRSAAAKKAARTKGAEGRSQAAKKAARTRARHEGRQRHNGATAHA